MNNFSRYWGRGAVPSCARPDLKIGQVWPLECRSQVEEVVGGVSSGLVNLHSKDALSDKSFSSFKELASPGGRWKWNFSPASESPDARASSTQQT